jgi:hypothetical protein
MAGVRSVDAPLGSVPQFVTPANLPAAVYGQPYSQDLTVSNGDGALTLQLIDQVLASGLTVAGIPGAPPRLRISGTPMTTGDNYLFARVTDADGDPAWRTFSFPTVGGAGALLECNFQGTNPALALPWTPAYVLRSNVTYSGWNKGAGISASAGNDALTWSQNMPADEASSTLSYAVSNNAYWQFSLTPLSAQPLNLRKAEVRFTILRIDYHAPREYAIFTSVGGLTNGAQVFDSGHFTDTIDREFVFTLPDAAAYSNLTTAVTFRLVGYSGQYAGHRTSLPAFKVTADLSTLPPYEQWKARHGIPPGAANNSDPDGDGIPLLLEYALNLDPSVPGQTGLPSVTVTNGFLTLTYTQVKSATDIRYLAEAAGAPGGPWSSAAADVDQAWQMVDQGDTQLVTARDKTATTNASKRFMRLNVQQVGSP